MVIWIELLGWIAAGFTITAYSMRTMLPLRVAAIFANVFFIAYGGLAGIYPNLALHLLLLPFNIFRLVEILRVTRRIRTARKADIDFDWLTQLISPRRFADKEILFRKGDRPDNLYYVVSGTIRLSEADIILGAGEFLGEIAFFTDAKERTLTAVCDGPCEVLPIDESTFMRLYYQNPAFGMYIVRLISRRLLQGMREMPQVYVPVVKTV